MFRKCHCKLSRWKRLRRREREDTTPVIWLTFTNFSLGVILYSAPAAFSRQHHFNLFICNNNNNNNNKMTAVICNDTHMNDQVWKWMLSKNGADKYRNIEIQVEISLNQFPVRNSCWLSNWIMDFALICTFTEFDISVVDFDILPDHTKNGQKIRH